jgi:hypothetical protein
MPTNPTGLGSKIQVSAGGVTVLLKADVAKSNMQTGQQEEEQVNKRVQRQESNLPAGAEVANVEHTDRSTRRFKVKG